MGVSESPLGRAFSSDSSPISADAAPLFSREARAGTGALNRQPDGSLVGVERAILVHYHIFKNAGMSVDAALKRCFAEQWSTFEGAHAHDVKSSSELREFLEANPHIRAVSSHLARPPLPSSRSAPVVFLRHPLLRARSVYEFTRQDSSQPFRAATSGSFAEYLEWALSGAPGGVVIRDYQVIHLSSASFCPQGILAARASEAELGEAIALLDTWPVVGVVEQYERSLHLMEQAYRDLFPGLTLRPEHINRTRAGVEEATVRREIGEDLFREFERQNRLDYRLHEYSLNRLAARS
jgi:hypothetical protein